MTSFVVTGKLGSGKTLVSVGRIFDYLAQGRRVATNLDINLCGYLNPQSKKTLIRLPDKPTSDDLYLLGSGNDSPNEEMNGLLVLDELGTWFNARSWQDKSRSALIDWFLHARKHGWDTLLIVQDIAMVDAQLRGALAEHLVICRRLDRVKIPFIGSFLKSLGMKGSLPKIHRAKVHYGENDSAMVVDTWTYRGKHFYNAYDTKQIFSPYYSSGVFSFLSPWHTKGRFLPVKKNLIDSFQQFINPPFVNPLPLKPKLLLVERIAKLPCPKMREHFYRRFQQSGSI